MRSIKLAPYSEDLFWGFSLAMDEEGTARLYPNEDERVAVRKRILSDEETVWRAIIDAESGEFLGYCMVHDKAKPEWELGITVLKAHHREGIGYAALNMLMGEMAAEYGERPFFVKIVPDNLASIRLFQKMGATPRGLRRGLFMLDEDAVNRFAEEHPELINDTVREMAELFGVEPKELLGRLLVFDVPYNRKVGLIVGGDEMEVVGQKGKIRANACFDAIEIVCATCFDG